MSESITFEGRTWVPAERLVAAEALLQRTAEWLDAYTHGHGAGYAVAKEARAFLLLKPAQVCTGCTVETNTVVSVAIDGCPVHDKKSTKDARKGEQDA